MSISKLLIAGSFAFALFSMPALAQQAKFDNVQRKEIEQLVKDYLLANPEILQQMADKLEEKNRAAEELARSEGLKTNAKTVFRLEGDAIAGNAKGDITIVEFMDYNCGWCKKSMVEVNELLQKDKNVRVVLKEFPIFGPNSEYAAKAALAANMQGKYWELHQALFSHEGQVTNDVVDQLAESLKLDMAKLKKDMEAPSIAQTIAANQELAKTLAINGTPGFVIDTEVVPGYVPLSTLVEKLASVRANGGCKIC